MTLKALLSRLALLHHVSKPERTVIEMKRAAWSGMPIRYPIQPTVTRYPLRPKFVHVDQWKAIYGG